MKYTAIMVLLLFIFMVFPLLGFAENPSGPRLITVTGDAEVNITPDEVILTLGVETWNKDLSVAKTENDQRTRDIIEIAKKSGIEEKHIQTGHISIEPRYEHPYERQKFIGYFVQKTIVLTLRDITKFEDILSSILEVGANYIHGIQFQTTELRKHRDKARLLAIRAAREKADALAGALEQKVGRPYKIAENRSDWWSGYNRWGAPGGGRMVQNAIQNTESLSDAAGSIAVGQIKVNATVTVSFELE